MAGVGLKKPPLQGEAPRRGGGVALVAEDGWGKCFLRTSSIGSATPRPRFARPAPFRGPFANAGGGPVFFFFNSLSSRSKKENTGGPRPSPTGSPGVLRILRTALNFYGVQQKAEHRRKRRPAAPPIQSRCTDIWNATLTSTTLGKKRLAAPPIQSRCTDIWIAALTSTTLGKKAKNVRRHRLYKAAAQTFGLQLTFLRR